LRLQDFDSKNDNIKILEEQVKDLLETKTNLENLVEE
jgi:hypothetical protein